jgi:hypothetical protein
VGTTGWQQHALVLDVAAAAATISFGAELSGEGVSCWYRSWPWRRSAPTYWPLPVLIAHGSRRTATSARPSSPGCPPGTGRLTGRPTQPWPSTPAEQVRLEVLESGHLGGLPMAIEFRGCRQKPQNVPLACPPCHSHARSEGRSRCRAGSHGHCHPTGELAGSCSSSMNASRGYA